MAGPWRWCVLHSNAAPVRQMVVSGGATGGGSGGKERRPFFHRGGPDQ